MLNGGRQKSAKKIQIVMGDSSEKVAASQIGKNVGWSLKKKWAEALKKSIGLNFLVVFFFAGVFFFDIVCCEFLAEPVFDPFPHYNLVQNRVLTLGVFFDRKLFFPHRLQTHVGWSLCGKKCFSVKKNFGGFSSIKNENVSHFWKCVHFVISTSKMKMSHFKTSAHMGLKSVWEKMFFGQKFFWRFFVHQKWKCVTFLKMCTFRDFDIKNENVTF